ncbi:4'-phosphopantetheinyl transferase family protein [Thetidibacter halocola]|uniref:Enterobactin synthase component D n=1 Tax=Thetidibacter halocola TaxID=2827239 RepID=A0A8J7WBI2_9RHOB|nr:4'-phosphopantetheinyl transferase superfamily protein [Thetidibacter halocola]MBS0123389.1 4'-phosphopantetheinyl transferase superfamily protein [Thetidibacter halocola]
MTQAALSSLVSALSRPGLHWGLAETGDPAALFLQEAAAMARARPPRLAEFTAGRLAARRAMQAAGCPPAAIPQGADRAPIWPRGLRGSISHAGGLAIAVIASDGQSPGLDLEPLTAIDPALAAEIRRPDEDGDLLRLFSAKEAAFKALYPLVGVMFGFHGMHVDLSRGFARLTDHPETATIAPDFHSARFPVFQATDGGLLMSLCTIRPEYLA